MGAECLTGSLLRLFFRKTLVFVTLTGLCYSPQAGNQVVVKLTSGFWHPFLNPELIWHVVVYFLKPKRITVSSRPPLFI